MQPHTGAFLDANGSAATVKLEQISAELNTFLKIDDDICAYGDATRESRIVEEALANVISRWVSYEEMMGNIAPQNRTELIPTHLYQDSFDHIKNSLMKDLREEHPRAINYNLRTGRLRKWY